MWDSEERGDYLIAFNFQLAALVELRVLETDAAELQVAGEHAAIIGGEGHLVVALLVNDLCHADDFVTRVLDGKAQHGTRVVARHHVYVVIEPLVLNKQRQFN